MDGASEGARAGGCFSLAFIEPGTPEYAEAAEVRYDALYADWKLPRTLIADTDGRVYRHLAALDEGRRVVGYARIWLDGGESRIFQVSVARDWRGRGVGAALVLRLMELARDAGQTHVDLDARVPVIPFYERLGFAVVSEEFLSGRTNTPHRTMRALLG